MAHSKQYVKSFIIDAANKAKSNGTDLSRYSFLVLDKNTGMVKDIDWDAYNSFTSRSKAPGAFDSRSNDSGENSYSVQVLATLITSRLQQHYMIQRLIMMYSRNKLKSLL